MNSSATALEWYTIIPPTSWSLTNAILATKTSNQAVSA
jgi:hypothetical protein